MFDYLIKNALLVDGSGAPARRGDLAVKDGRIAAEGGSIREGAVKTIDADGLVLSPGFIDIHSHYDCGIFADAALESVMAQGVTSVISGQCGDSRAPLEDHMVDGFAKWCAAGAAGAKVPYNWRSFGSFLDTVDSMHLGVNMGSLVGHSTLRLCAVGFDNRPATEKEIALMRSLASAALSEGALGLSTGLVYMPGMYADTAELIEVCRALTPFNAPYMSHIRSESNELPEAVEEALTIARAVGVPCHIAHHKALGQSNWNKIDISLARIDAARDAGEDVTVDVYPYILSTSAMRNLLPPWALEGGIETVAARLHDPEIRARIIREIESGDSANNIWRDAGGAEGVFAMDTHYTPQYEGKNMLEASLISGRSPLDTALDIIAENKGWDTACYATGCEENIRKVLKKPYSMVGSDAVPCAPGAKCNPRTNGTFPRILGKYTREEKVLTLEEAVYKISGAAAKRLKLKGKGLLKAGYDADLVLFDPLTVIDKATTTDPLARPEGIEWVFVNGIAAVKDGKCTGARAGRAIRREA